MSGTCMAGECSEQCLTDDDCPSEAPLCIRQATIHHNGCVDTPVYCAQECEAGEQCAGEQCLVYCASSGDCPHGDCAIPPSDMAIMAPSCVPPADPDIDGLCKPEEFIHLTGNFCYLPGLCYIDDDCDEPYVCNGSCRRGFQD